MVMKGVIQIFQSANITGVSASDSLVSYIEHWEMQSENSIISADWAEIFLAFCLTENQLLKRLLLLKFKSFSNAWLYY